MLEHLKLVIFDMDGLMFDTERRYCDDMKKICDEQGIDVDMSALYDVIGTSLPIDMDCFNRSGYSHEKIAEIMNQSVIDAVNDMCENGVPMKAGLVELLKVLNEKKILMAVATSTKRSRCERLLKAAKIDQYFDCIITGYDVANGKPFPDIFLEACRKCQIDPADALVLEDSVNGGMAAKSAGIPYIIVPDLNPPTAIVKESALKVVPSLHEVVQLIS